MQPTSTTLGILITDLFAPSINPFVQTNWLPVHRRQASAFQTTQPSDSVSYGVSASAAETDWGRCLLIEENDLAVEAHVWSLEASKKWYRFAILSFYLKILKRSEM
jgi:hypothetical protein